MAVQLTTTLNRIRAHGPCEDGWTKLLAGLGKTQADDEPLTFATILRISGLDFALWCARAEPQHSRVWRLFRVWCARRVQHLLTDPRSLAALDVAERYALGMATDEELRAVGEAAWDAIEDDERDATLAAGAAALATWATAGTARAAARAAAWEAGGDAWDAWDAWAAAQDAQAAKFLRIVGGE
jgi:hypothetical protein